MSKLIYIHIMTDSVNAVHTADTLDVAYQARDMLMENYYHKFLNVKISLHDHNPIPQEKVFIHYKSKNNEQKSNNRDMQRV